MDTLTDALELSPNREVPASRNPAAVYLGKLPAPSSQRTMRAALANLVSLATGGREAHQDARWAAIATFPWHQVGYAEAQRLRSLLTAQLDPAAAAGGRVLRPATVNKHITALKGVLRESWRLGYLTADDHARIQDSLMVLKHTALPKGRMLQRAELQKMFEACARDARAGRPSGVRDAAVLALMAGCGLRRSEPVALQLGDYAGAGAEREVVVRGGKGRKDRTVPVGRGTREALDAWVTIRGDAPGPLLYAVTKGGVVEPRAVSTQALWKVVEKRARQARLSPATPHDLRRTFASALLDAGADLGVVQDLMGHQDPATTRKYDRRGELAKRRAVEIVGVPYFCGPVLLRGVNV